jgi:hypothetical protein
LKDLNADTGAVTQPGEYVLADKAYSKLLRQLAEDHFACVTPELRANILGFYSDSSLSNAKKEDKKNRRKIATELERLRLRPAPAGVAERCKAK